MQISGWGKYPSVNAEIVTALSNSQLQGVLQNGFKGIARGLGRSYGDSALASQVIDFTSQGKVLDFDPNLGTIRCCAGISLADLLICCVKSGWFPAVTPGTKFVTLGGAIASDVHGKNHHVHGTFTDHVTGFHLLLSNGTIEYCSRELRSELFRATCGGMGLTGIILDAALNLTPINSTYIQETTCKARNLAELFELFSVYNKSTYSVAWIDCMSTGASMGRSLLLLGEHANNGNWEMPKKLPLAVPVDMPGFLLNPYSISVFNALYYHRILRRNSTNLVHYERFFYPLDSIAYWNRLYGSKGFVQYQFVIPKEAGLDAMTTILKIITASKRGSFLAVLKVFGNANENMLSFPMAGYTLSLDFKLQQNTLDLLNELDALVLDYGGRIYLAKDARMREDVFKKSYPRWAEFSSTRAKYKAGDTFQSMQSIRLGL